MTEIAYHSKVRLVNFTAFGDATFEFCPGINAIIGENGTGKTHLLKAMYAFQRTSTREVRLLIDALLQLFQCQDVETIRRQPVKRHADTTAVHGHFGGLQWHYVIEPGSLARASERGIGKPVFIPALDMMGHSKGFQQAYNRVFLDFDLTCSDIVSLFMLRSKPSDNMTVAESSVDYQANDRGRGEPKPNLHSILGGKVVPDESTGRFYLETPSGRLEMPMVGEGLRKIASLVRLQDNNWLTPGTTLYWDEPEVNINPVLMRAIVAELLRLARTGIQIFLTTHSYVILKELDLQAKSGNSVRYFSLSSHGKAGTNVTTSETLTDLNPNSILDHYGSLYDRDLDKSLGGG